MIPVMEHKRVLTAAMVGTAVEFYDFFIYGTAAALLFGRLFFPAESAAAQTLLAFASFGVAFLARPIGAVVFGHFGDRIGRKATLVSSLLLMGGSTLAIAFLPTYATAGWIAPALLCLMRFGQGFALGGEWGGAALLATEYAPKGWESRFVSIMQLGAPIGFFTATGVFLLLGLWLDEAAFNGWGWRIPFIASAVLVLLGLWIRLKIEETPAFRAVLEREVPVRVPFAALMRHHALPVLAGTLGTIAIFAIFYLITAFSLAHATGVVGYARGPFLLSQMAASLFYALGILIGGVLADQRTPAFMLGLMALLLIPVGFTFIPALETRELIIGGGMLCAGMFVLGIGNGGLGNWLASLFPVALRYSGVSVAFNAAGILGGATTPILAQAMSAGGYSGQIGWILVVAALLTLIGLWLARGLEHPMQEQAA